MPFYSTFKLGSQWTWSSYQGPLSEFQSELVVRKIEGESRKWELVQPLVYVFPERLLSKFEVDPIVTTIVSQTGETTDFASIPRFVWWLLPPDGKYSWAAVIHDYLCKVKGQVFDTRSGTVEKFSVKEVSLIFESAMEEMGVPALTRAIMYRAVLTFGPKW